MVFVAVGKYLPLSAGVLDGGDRDFLVFVVSKTDFYGSTFHAVGGSGVIEFLTLSNDVESISNIEANHLIARSMIDFILSDELQRAIIVLLVDSDFAFRQRHTEMILLAVAQLHLHVYFLRAGIAGR